MATVASATYDPANVTWSKLELEASKLFLTARSEVELDCRPSSSALGELLDSRLLTALADGKGRGLTPRGPQSGVLDIRSRILKRKSDVRFWFDPDDGRALQRSSHDRSKKRLRHRTYRYTQGGVLSHTLTPRNGEGNQPPTGWSQVDAKHFDFEPLGESSVTEAAGLLYLIPAGEFHSPGDRERLRVFTRGKVREVDVAVAGKERLGVEYVEAKAGGGERPVDGSIDALRVTIRARAEGGSDSDFKLLGLSGDIDIHLEPRTRVPLLITGKVDVLGTVRLRLRRVVLR